MRTSLYIVYESRKHWWVDADGIIRGPYDSRDEAQQAASLLASEKSGEKVDVYSPDEAGRNVKVWSTGEG